MARGDFHYLPVNQTFDSGSPEWEDSFDIGQEVIPDEGYLLVTVRSVDSENHRIRINGTDMSGFDIPNPPGDSNAWFTYMDRINPGVLQAGSNTIEIVRSADDNFVVKDLVVHWRELTASGGH